MNIISLPLFVMAVNFSRVLQCPSLNVETFNVFTFIELKHRFHVLLSVPLAPDDKFVYTRYPVP